MENLEQENRELREEVTALKTSMDNLNALMEQLVAAQNQPPLVPPYAQPPQTTVTYKGPLVPIYVTSITAAQNHMPQGYPWGMPGNFMPEGYNLDALVAPIVQATTTLAPHVVHVTPAARNEIHYDPPLSVNAILFVNDEVYRHVPPPSESVGFYDWLDEFQDHFNEMQKEMKALQGKELFG